MRSATAELDPGVRLQMEALERMQRQDAAGREDLQHDGYAALRPAWPLPRLLLCVFACVRDRILSEPGCDRTPVRPHAAPRTPGCPT
eukprot:765451-Hanusia_phi.AAC.2